MSNLLSKRVACERLACSLSTLNRALAAGRLRSVKIGSAVRIPESALNDFITRLLETADDR